MNFAYIQSQTFGDVALEAELLELFLDQVRRLVPTLPRRTAQDQADTAHLLKGSARAVGAGLLAAALEAYEAAPPGERAEDSLPFAAVSAAVAEVQTSIEERLATIAAGLPEMPAGRR